MQDAEQTLRTALARHQAGDLGPAEEAYRQILARDPENAPATQFLGMLAHQTGSHETGRGPASSLRRTGTGRGRIPQ